MSLCLYCGVETGYRYECCYKCAAKQNKLMEPYRPPRVKEPNPDKRCPQCKGTGRIANEMKG